jgi:ABC-type multidrug transport system fused ATPase/permease subunit
LDELKTAGLQKVTGINNKVFQLYETKLSRHGVMIVGESGSGKSTLIDIILGLLMPTDGRVISDKYDISFNLKEWQSKIGYVPQVIYLTDDSLKKNIAFGIPEEMIDYTKLDIAIKASQLDSFIHTLPDGINTFVGERGVRISGGQRQRIGIARALYNNPEILVLDEATSALDTEIEEEVMNSVYNLIGQKTIIIVAHRISTLSKCNKIYKVENSKITLI